MAPVAQKVQPMPQPAWELRQMVVAPGRSVGICTVSTAAPSTVRNKVLRVPSDEVSLRTASSAS